MEGGEDFRFTILDLGFKIEIRRKLDGIKKSYYKALLTI